MGNLPADSKVFVKVVADRDLTDGTVKDVYRDSNYKEAVYKAVLPNTGEGSGAVIPSAPAASGESHAKSEDEHIQITDSETPLSSSDNMIELSLDAMSAKNNSLTLTSKNADKIIEQLKTAQNADTAVISSEKLVKNGLTVKLSKSFLKKMAASGISRLTIKVKNWYVTIDKKKLKSLAASSKYVTLFMKEVKASKLYNGKKYKASGTAFNLEIERYSKDGASHHITLPVTAKYKIYNKTLCILRKTYASDFKRVKKSAIDKELKELTTSLKSIRQTLVLVSKK